MSYLKKRPSYGIWLYSMGIFASAAYFTFAAVQGDYGVFHRIQIEAEAEILREELAVISAEVREMENKTHRLSDEYLDLDLLDEQSRSVLGLVRSDEIVIR
ncbi:septum formation initiator family protein [Falsihalocynthiibacter sp. SS001]|uniref:FtsB family cell division protein n=1 Tax=Falsihalocynthiibacter sp. SS001 TaxID=3349698 RepID=UPI0036D35A57